MDNNRVPERPAAVPKKRLSDFWIGFIGTAVPVAATSIAAMVLIFNRGQGWLLFIPSAIWVAAMIAAIVMVIAGNKWKRLASGIFTGAGISIVIFGITCFASVFSL